MRLVACLAGIAAAGPLAGEDVVVSEILARAGGPVPGASLLDEDGESSDWIELQSLSASPLDLEGWHLTDDPSLLLKWRFPAVTLPAGGFLVVFASGKDRAAAGAELHASFRLDGDGEYLALVRPDGLTVVDQHAPRFPPQREGVSYGRLVEAVSLVAAGAAADILVPQDGALGSVWRLPEFEPGAEWTRGAATGVGYAGPGSVPDDLVAWWPLDGDLADHARSHDGVFRGAPAAAFTAGHDGTPGAAVLFDGTDDLVEAATGDGIPLYAHAELSVALWVKGPPQPDRRVFSEGSGASNSPVFNIGTDVTGTTGKVDLFIRTASGQVLLGHVQSAGTAFDGAWHHLQLPGDANQDARLEVSDALRTFHLLFFRPGVPLPCDGAGPGDGGSLLLLDANGDGAADLSDVVHLLNYLLLAGPAHERGTRCARLEGCPEGCR